MKINSRLLSLQSFWAISSAGSEHLPYKQGVTGSNPVSPTSSGIVLMPIFCIFHSAFLRKMYLHLKCIFRKIMSYMNKMGLWCSLVSTSACQAEGRGFKSRRPRKNKAPSNRGFIFLKKRSTPSASVQFSII